MAYDLTVSLTGANGDTIVFDNDVYTLMTGLKGFGVPATNLRIMDSSVDGGIFRHTKRGVREIDLPVMVYGADRATTEGYVRRLANAINNVNGPATLRVQNLTDGNTYSINVYYAGGAETVFGDTAGLTFCNWMLTLQAPDPFWYSNATQTFTVTSGQTGRGLLPRLSNLRVTNSQAIGTINVNNTIGDVPSYPVWQLYGPMDSCTITQNGVGFTYNAPIAAGDVVTIDTKASTVTNVAGGNVYGNLSAAPKFFTIPAGVSSMSVYGVNTTSATQITCSYLPRREVIH
jgi:phage-related protein